MRQDAMRMSFVAWDPYTRRSDLLAGYLGAAMHHVYVGRRGNAFRAPGRYIGQARLTWKILMEEKPEVVLVQNPPIFCAVVAFLYTRRQGGRYVIDSHTAAFISRKWKWSLGLHRLLSGHAAVTLVHNDAQARIVEQWGVAHCVLGDPVGSYPTEERYPLAGGFNVAVVSTFGEDEPIEAIVEATKHLPEVQFYITGDAGPVDRKLLGRRPGNCHLTGYLPYGKYVGLLRGADAILDLSLRDDNLLAGAFEAAAVGTPLIISDWPILRRRFCFGTVHVSNTVDGICEGIRRAQRDQEELRRGILRLREQLQTRWDGEFRQFIELLEGTGAARD